MSQPESSDFKKLQKQDRKNDVNRVSQSSNDLACYQPGGSKFFGALENSASLEEPRLIYKAVPYPVDASTKDSSQPLSQPVDSTSFNAQSSNLTPSDLNTFSHTPIVENEAVERSSDINKSPLFEETISLLEERLVIDSHKRKVGEVIVRKEIETRIVEVPVRREKLIVEQISPTFKQLAVVDLGQIDQTGFDQITSIQNPQLDTTAHVFNDANAAIQFLEAIASKSSTSNQTVHISVALKDNINQSFNS